MNNLGCTRPHLYCLARISHTEYTEHTEFFIFFCVLLRCACLGGVYYDFGAHVANTDWEDDLVFLSFAIELFGDCDGQTTKSRLKGLLPIGYRGVINADTTSTELRLSSIDDKNSRPICFISYNQSGYSVHCRQYVEYQTWVKERNPQRYESNLDKSYDSKNMMHCFRMIHMACENAEGKGVILERTWDREFLMNVRNHKFEYDEIIDLLEEEKERMNLLMEQSTIREIIDADFVNQLMINIRNAQLKSQ